ncbi:MAG: response regulator transcription factor [Acidimicrobiia bacterium]|nr:response regulator transcription factor [Acidimicrobiia bacterium]NNC42408.1 response regulator transcription factor [Acidimicrobiia bacterium]NNL29173.1 response regulator transcription factor [Acidimicrobiia bacterium]
MSIRVFVVDDHGLFRAGVRSELDGHVDLIGDADDVDAAIELILERKPDVVLVDVHMPGGGGRRVVKKVLETDPDVAFLALSTSDAPEDVIALIRTGARGYVTKTIATDELVEAISRVHNGDAVFSPKLAGYVLDTFTDIDIADVDPELDLLTDREQEVMRHIARGYTYREVGEALFISVKTVETHVSKVLRKLQLSNRNELTRWAADRKLL